MKAAQRHRRSLIITLAVLVYIAAMVFFGWRAGFSEFVGDLFSWPVSTKWFIAYSALYFTGAVLLAFSIRSGTIPGTYSFRRGFCVCALFALMSGGCGVYVVFGNLAFKLQS